MSARLDSALPGAAIIAKRCAWDLGQRAAWRIAKGDVTNARRYAVLAARDGRYYLAALDRAIATD